MVRGGSWSFVVVRGGSWWFVVARGGSWWFVVVRGGSWWFVVIRGGWWWFVVVRCCLWWFVVVHVGSWWFVVVCGGSWWFVVVRGGSWCFVVVPGGSWWFVVVCGGSLRCCGVAAACLFFTRGSASSPRNTQQGLLAEGTPLTTSAIWAVVVDCGPDGVATPPHRCGGPAMCWGRRAGAGTDWQQNSRDICQSFAAAQSRVRWSPIAFGTRCQQHRPMSC